MLIDENELRQIAEGNFEETVEPAKIQSISKELVCLRLFVNAVVNSSNSWQDGPCFCKSSDGLSHSPNCFEARCCFEEWKRLQTEGV